MKRMTLKELQNASLEIVKDIDRFCQKEGIRYSLGYGSMLGAVRHKGFIPWDDDMDILMPRPDYERFMRTYSSERYSFSSAENDENCFIAFGRVHDTRETCVFSRIPWHRNGPTGIWVDIFPLDGAPDDDEVYDRRYEMASIVNHTAILTRKGHADCCSSITLRSMMKILFFRHFHSSYKKRDPHTLASCILDLAKMEDYGSCRRVTQMCCSDSKESIFPREWFEESIRIPFQDTTLCVSSRYDDILTLTYGDYMKLPPAKKRKPLQRNHMFFYWK